MFDTVRDIRESIYMDHNCILDDEGQALSLGYTQIHEDKLLVILFSSSFSSSILECYTNQKPQILMAKSQGFPKVVRANAITHRKRQKSKLLRHRTQHIFSYLRAYINAVLSDMPYHVMNALTSEHQNPIVHRLQAYLSNYHADRTEKSRFQYYQMTSTSILPLELQ